jgi:hypothetical protein
VRELEGAIERGELDFALGYARELVTRGGRALDLELGLGLLALIAAQRPREYDAWSVRWLVRWIAQARAPTIARTAQVARGLADLAALRAGAKDAVLRAMRA